MKGNFILRSPLTIATIFLLLSACTFTRKPPYEMNEQFQSKEIPQSYGVVLNQLAIDRIARVTGEYLQSTEFLKDVIGSSSAQSKSFCAYRLYGIEEKAGAIGEYLWVFCQEYILENKQLKLGTGVSFPLVIRIQQQQDRYRVNSYKRPRDGSLYKKDMDKLFPRYIRENPKFPHNNITYSNQMILNLRNTTFQDAKAYFKIP